MGMRSTRQPRGLCGRSWCLVVAVALLLAASAAGCGRNWEQLNEEAKLAHESGRPDEAAALWERALARAAAAQAGNVTA